MTREEAISVLKNTAWLGTDKKVGEVEKAIMMAVEALKAQDATVTNVGSNDLISRRDAIDVVKKNTFRLTFAEEQNCEGHVAWSAEAVYSEVMEGALLELPSAQPEITDGQAVEHLQASGWMQNHDKQMYEMGLRERLADDGDSYDALLPSAQPEEAIPVAWLEEQAKWFKSKDNAFAKIEATNIRVMIKKWRSEKDERSDRETGGD